MFRNRTAIGITLFALAASLSGNEAKVFTIKQSSTEIVSDRDHLDLVFVQGWLSKRDKFLDALLSANTKTAASISASGRYWDNDELANAWIAENTDVGSNLNRPWAVANKVLLKDLPADTLNLAITVRLELHRENRLKQILSSIQGSEPALGTAVEPYLTYANLVNKLFTSVFGTDKTRFPFLMDAGLADSNVSSPDGMYEHFLVGISSNSDRDGWLSSLNGTKLQFDAASRALKYDGAAVDDHTWVVFQIKRAPAPNLPRLLYNSKAPWAIHALANFYQVVFPEIGGAQDIPKHDKEFVEKLGNCVDLLKRELRFSASDRATALFAFAEQGKALIRAACAAKNIAASDCRTPQLDAYEKTIGPIMGVKKASTEKAVFDGAREFAHAWKSLAGRPDS